MSKCHKKYMKNYTKNYYQKNKEKLKEYNKEYGKEYRQTHKEQKKKYDKNYNQTHKEQIKKYDKNYRQTHKEQILQRDYKRRGLGWVSFNNWFEGSHGHHIDKTHVIYIPKKLHRSIYHNVFTGYNMDKINAKVIEWLDKQNKQNSCVQTSLSASTATFK